MKITTSVSLFILFALAGCSGNKQSGDDFITVDVNATYPEKELILQDIMDVEYIPLETNDDFITHGVVEGVGKDIVLVSNYRDGNIFVFDRKTGKGLRQINRFGQGGEEYSQTTTIILDEDNNEMFVEDYPARKIVVYDLFGNFKRKFKFTDTGYYDFVFNYDHDNLICYKNYLSESKTPPCHLLVSKQDGSITREIRVPFDEIRTPKITQGEIVVTPQFYLTIPCNDYWALTNPSSDTVYKYPADGNMQPLIVRTPSIQSMEKEVFLFLNSITDRYYFMSTMKKEVDFVTFKGFPKTGLVYDKQEKALFESLIYNADFVDKKQVNFDSTPINHEVVTYLSLGAPNLVGAYEKGEIKDGKLKEIAATLDEESNPVIMLIKQKK